MNLPIAVKAAAVTVAERAKPSFNNTPISLNIITWHRAALLPSERSQQLGEQICLLVTASGAAIAVGAVSLFPEIWESSLLKSMGSGSCWTFHHSVPSRHLLITIQERG